MVGMPVVVGECGAIIHIADDAIGNFGDLDSNFSHNVDAVFSFITSSKILFGRLR
jgi:hypothetical protein